MDHMNLRTSVVAFAVIVFVGTLLAAIAGTHTPSFDLADPSRKPVEASVTRVIDGDTIEVELNGKTEKVRYIGIDTPESVDPRRPVQCYGKNAAVRNKELVLGKTVGLVRDITDRDRFGRLLRYVYVGDSFINLQLVREGYAQTATFPPDVQHKIAFLEAEREARASKRGLWASCPAAQQ